MSAFASAAAIMRMNKQSRACCKGPVLSQRLRGCPSCQRCPAHLLANGATLCGWPRVHECTRVYNRYYHNYYSYDCEDYGHSFCDCDHDSD